MQKLIFKYPQRKPPFIGVVFDNNETAVIAQHLLKEVGQFTLTLRIGRYPYMNLGRKSNEPYDHGSRTNYQFVSYEVSDLNAFADVALQSSPVNLGHVLYDEKGNLQIARTAEGKPFVIRLTKFDLFDPDKHYGTAGI